MGDTVNTTARLSSAAGAGELLVTLSSAEHAGLADPSAKRRSLSLKGNSKPVEVLVFDVGATVA